MGSILVVPGRSRFEHHPGGRVVGQDPRPATLAAIRPAVVDVAADTRLEHGVDDVDTEQVVFLRFEITDAWLQRTQMDDIADRVGVSKSTIYRSVESKEALLSSVLLYADRPALLAGVTSLDPIAWPDLSARLRDELASSVLNLGLATAARPTAKARGRKAGDIGAEVEQLALELYSMLASRRIAVMVLDRCAAEIPAITGDWYELGRYALVDLWTDYLLGRQRQVASTVDPAVLARTIIELITLWAVKMPWDPAPRLYPGDHGKSCATMIRALVTGAPS